jgi:hypothetical protein
MLKSKLHWDSGTTLQSLNLTCRDFNQIVSPRLFRTIRILSPEKHAAAYSKTVSHLQQNVGQGVYPHVRVLILSYAGYTSNGRSMPELRVDPALIYGLVAKLRNLEIIKCEGSL